MGHRTPLPLIGLGFSLAISGCSATTNEAAPSVRQFLLAVESGDDVVLDSKIDRQQLKIQVLNQAKSKNLDASGLGSAFDYIYSDRMIRITAMIGGLKSDTKIPSEQKLSRYLIKIDSNTVCLPLRRKANCYLRFSRGAGTWRLSGMAGDFSGIGSMLTEIES